MAFNNVLSALNKDILLSALEAFAENLSMQSAKILLGAVDPTWYISTLVSGTLLKNWTLLVVTIFNPSMLVCKIGIVKSKSSNFL